MRRNLVLKDGIDSTVAQRAHNLQFNKRITHRYASPLGVKGLRNFITELVTDRYVCSSSSRSSKEFWQ